MTKTNEEVISILNNLIETCKDGQEGFKHAAEGILNNELKSLFYDYSQQRAQFAGELQDQVRLLGGNPENTGSIAGTLHRGWLDIKTAVLGKDQQVILNECERGEDSALNNYKNATSELLPRPISEIVNSQAIAIEQAHNHIRNLRDTTKMATA